MSTWEEVVSAALVGARTRAVDAENLNAVVAQHVTRVVDTDPSVRVLQIAALTAVATQASGPVPDLTAQPLPPVPADPRPLMSELASAHVGRAFTLSPAVANWCVDLLSHSRFRPPMRLLPDLLRRTAHNVAIRPKIERIAGPAGYWLAEYAPDLGAVLPREEVGTTPREDPTVWTHGALSERTAYLRALRGRDPIAGAELLAAGWASESGPDREALLDTLTQGASVADEDFLERALDDRRGAVRATAARILDIIPESGLQQRLFAAASPHLEMRGRLRKKLHVTLPAEPDDDLRRDGVTVKPPRGTGLRVWVLAQLLSRIPPSRWEAQLGADPTTIVDAIGPEDGVVVESLCRAAVLHRDQRWADALVGHREALPDVARAASTARLVSVYPDLPAEKLPALLALIDAPWPEPIARHTFAAVARLLRENTYSAPAAARLLDALAVGLPATDRWQEAVAQLSATAVTGHAQLAVVSEALRVRSVLTKELQ